MKPNKLVESLSSREKRAVLKALGEGYGDKDQLARLLNIAPAAGGVATKAARREAKPKDAPTSLKPEQRKQAEAVIANMAEKFERPPEDFGVVMVENEAGEKRPVVMLTAGNGLYKGSWNTVMSDAQTEAFTIVVNGKQIDTRSAMTEDAYRAFIADEKARGIEPLPDSSQLSNENGQPWTWTLLTGEQAHGFDAPVAYVRDGNARRSWGSRVRSGSLVRVRPAVVIE